MSITTLVLPPKPAPCTITNLNVNKPLKTTQIDTIALHTHPMSHQMAFDTHSSQEQATYKLLCFSTI